MKIPTANGPGLLNTNVKRMQTQDINSAGMVQRAQTQAFKAVTDTAQKVGTIIQNEEIKSFTQKSQAEYTVQADEMYGKMSTDNKYEDNPDLFQKDYAKGLKDLKTGLLKNAPGSKAQRIAEGTLNGSELNYTRQGASFVRNQKVNNIYKSKQDVLDLYSTHIVTKFNPNDLNQTIERKAQLINEFKNADLFDSKRSEAGIEDVNNKFFQSMVQNAEVTPNNADGILRILKSEDKKSMALKQGVDPKNLANAIIKLQRIKDTNKTISRSQFNRRASDFKTAISNGDIPKPEQYAELMGMIDKEAPDAAESMDMIIGLKTVGDKFEKYMDASGEEKKNLIREDLDLIATEDKTFNATTRGGLEAFYKEGIQKLNKDMNTRGADYVVKDRRDLAVLSGLALDIDAPVDEYTENVKSFVSSSLAIQKEKGIINPRVTTDEQVKTFSNLLKNSKGEQASFLIEKLSTAYGERSGEFLKEMITHGKMEDKYVPAMLMSDSGSRQQYMDNLRNEKDINALVKGMPDAPDYSIVKNNEKLTAFVSAIATSDPAGKNSFLSAGLMKAVTLEYGRRVSSGEDANTAGQAAVDSVINKNYDIAEENNALIIPKDLGVDKDKVEDFVSKTMSGNFDYLDSLEIDIPPHMKAELEKNPTRGKTASDIYKNHISESGVWVWDGSDGATLFENTGGAYAEVKNKMGQRISVKYKDMENHNIHQQPSKLLSNVKAPTSIIKSGRGL